jgi:hypothetical protein
MFDLDLAKTVWGQATIPSVEFWRPRVEMDM